MIYLMVFLWVIVGGFLGYLDWKKSFNEINLWYSLMCSCLGPLMIVLILFHTDYWRY